MPRFLTLALGLALALAAAPPALAVPPANDNYLGSVGITGSQTVDTTEATTQADLFDPNRDGLPFGGSGPEPLSCPVAPSYGKTVWYDFKPPTPGGIRIATTGAFDNVIAVYEWTEATSQLGRLVACVNATAGVSEELLMALRERNYTMQFGGVGGAGGVLNFTFEYFQDTDGDTVLDEDPDKCLRLRGIRDFGGCPPVVRGSPRLTVTGTGAGVRVAKLTIDRANRGTLIKVGCRRCGGTLRARAKRAGTVRLRGFEGRSIPAGDRLEVRLTHPSTSSGRFRFGAIGKTVRWPITSTGLGSSKVSCTRPGSRKAIRCP